MKTLAVVAALSLAVTACQSEQRPTAAPSLAADKQVVPAAAPAKEEERPLDPTNIVSIAVGSKDHTTLVAALKAADYVDSVANPGPFTVFAPTNEAFDKLPKGTVESLTQPEKKEDLRNVLKNHVAVSVYKQKDFKDGMTLSAANGGKLTFHVKDGKVTVNGANIVASIPASNGIVHVVDAVILPSS